MKLPAWQDIDGSGPMGSANVPYLPGVTNEKTELILRAMRENWWMMNEKQSGLGDFFVDVSRPPNARIGKGTFDNLSSSVALGGRET
jgi:hypothetical protein